MSRARVVLPLAVVVGVVVATTAAASPAEARIDYCGHRSDYDLRHPHYRLEFVSGFDRGSRHYHQVRYHQQLLGADDWVTTIPCTHAD